MLQQTKFAVQLFACGEVSPAVAVSYSGCGTPSTTPDPDRRHQDTFHLCCNWKNCIYSMTIMSASCSLHRRQVMALYRRLLSLHRRLPPDFANVGTQFVRSEFKRHKDSKAEYVGKCMQEWTVSLGMV